MVPAVALASIGAFIAAFGLLGIARIGTQILAIARGAVATMRDEAIDEETREKNVQQAALRLLGAFIAILTRSSLALAVSLAPIWLADQAGLAAGGEVVAYLARWDVIAVASVAMLTGFAVWRRLWASS